MRNSSDARMEERSNSLSLNNPDIIYSITQSIHQFHHRSVVPARFGSILAESREDSRFQLPPSPALSSVDSNP